jgi:chromosome segregation ATPase
MDCVEREFERRDATIYDLEGRLRVDKSKVLNLEMELTNASKIIESQKAELMAARNTQKTLVEQCEHVEVESSELQEFLQIEKMALAETLKDAETEIETLQDAIKSKDVEVKETENRCGHLVRIGEQRHQELITSQQKLSTFQERAKNMLINQVRLFYLKITQCQRQVRVVLGANKISDTYGM